MIRSFVRYIRGVGARSKPQAAREAAEEPSNDLERPQSRPRELRGTTISHWAAVETGSAAAPRGRSSAPLRTIMER